MKERRGEGRESDLDSDLDLIRIKLGESAASGEYDGDARLTKGAMSLIIFIVGIFSIFFSVWREL